jgi:ribonuclease D
MRYVESDREVGEVADRIGDSELIAADTEAAGYHRYHDRVCLLQLSTRTDTFVIDTLAVDQLEPLAALFARPETEVVLHDADFDLRLLARDFGIAVRGLFDTKIAAQFLGESAIGLGGLVEKHLGIRLEKKHQRADWAQRPLPADMIEYAAEDTRYLPPLRDVLRDALRERGRLAWAEEEFRLQEAVRWDADENGDAFLRMKNTRDLKPRQLAALRELHAWREAIAQEKDAAPFRVVNNEVLIAAARALPRTQAQLAETAGVPASVAQRRGAEMLAAVRTALELPELELPVRPRGPARPPPDPEFEKLVDRLKAARDRAADELALDRGFLMPRYQLERLARERPTSLEALHASGDIRGWQVEALGDALLAALAS